MVSPRPPPAGRSADRFHASSATRSARLPRQLMEEDVEVPVALEVHLVDLEDLALLVETMVSPRPPPAERCATMSLRRSAMMSRSPSPSVFAALSPVRTVSPPQVCNDVQKPITIRVCRAEPRQNCQPASGQRCRVVSQQKQRQVCKSIPGTSCKVIPQQDCQS